MPRTQQVKRRRPTEPAIRPVFPDLRPLILGFVEIARFNSAEVTSANLPGGAGVEAGFHSVDIPVNKLYFAGAKCRRITVRGSFANVTGTGVVTFRARRGPTTVAALNATLIGADTSTSSTASEMLFSFFLNSIPTDDIRISFTGSGTVTGTQNVSVTDIVIEGEFVE